MATTTWYLGPPGALVALPPPGPGIDRPRPKRVGTHELLAGGNVVDRWGGRRRYTLSWEGLSADELSVIEAVAELPGPLALLDPSRRNLLTANQATGTDALRTTEGLVFNTQGTVTSSSTFARSGTRSARWDTVTALAATGRGITFANSSTVPDATWVPIRPSTQYTMSLWGRASASVTMKARVDWCDATGAVLQTLNGSDVVLGAGGWLQMTATGTSHASSAYALCRTTNSATTGAAVLVYLDDAQFEEAAAASAWVLGTGVPRVVVVDLASSTRQVGWENAELVLQEV